MSDRELDSEISGAAVLDVLGTLTEAGIDAWVAGGWAVDALVGEQTRPHGDLDLAVRSDDVDDAVIALGRIGYATSNDLRPARLVLEAVGGGGVDLHPVVFDAGGVGRQFGDGGRAFEYPADAFAFGM